MMVTGLVTGEAEARSWGRQIRIGWVYEVTITNITKGTDLSQGLVFTPILVASHAPGVSVFELGEPASDELAMLAEGGDTAPLSAVLAASRRAHSTTTTAAPLFPGESVTVKLRYTGRPTQLTLASMLLPTNGRVPAWE